MSGERTVVRESLPTSVRLVDGALPRLDISTRLARGHVCMTAEISVERA